MAAPIAYTAAVRTYTSELSDCDAAYEASGNAAAHVRAAAEKVSPATLAVSVTSASPPRHDPVTTAARPRHARGTTAARPRHHRGTPAARPRHHRGTPAARPRHRRGTPAAHDPVTPPHIAAVCFFARAVRVDHRPSITTAARDVNGTTFADWSSGGRYESRSTSRLHHSRLRMRRRPVPRSGDEPRGRIRRGKGKNVRQPRSSAQSHRRRGSSRVARSNRPRDQGFLIPLQADFVRSESAPPFVFHFEDRVSGTGTRPDVG